MAQQCRCSNVTDCTWFRTRDELFEWAAGGVDFRPEHGYLFNMQYKCRPFATVRSILMKRHIVLLIEGISEQRASRFLLGAAVVKVNREYVQIDARHCEDVHRIIAARGSLSCDNLCTEDWVFVMQTPENESCLTYQMRHASQGPNVSWRGKKRKEKLDTAVMILIFSGAWDR